MAFHSKEVSLLKRLMEHFVDEVERGNHPKEAGWIQTEGTEANELIKLGLAERGEKGIRLQFSPDLENWVRKSRDRQAIELANICSDIGKAMHVEKMMTRIANESFNSYELKAGLMLIGWWRMFETSDFPVFMDTVLREGISPDEWYLEAPKASLDLALTVVSKFWKVSEEEIFNRFKKLDFTVPEVLRTDKLDHIKRILKWDKVLRLLSEEASKALAFLWFADYLFTFHNVSYPEALTFVQARSWDLLTNNLEKRRLEIVDEIERLIEGLPASSEIGWAEIIRLPW